MLEKIRGYYEQGLWSKERVKNVVGKVIDENEYFEITGEEYETK